MHLRVCLPVVLSCGGTCANLHVWEKFWNKIYRHRLFDLYGWLLLCLIWLLNRRLSFISHPLRQYNGWSQTKYISLLLARILTTIFYYITIFRNCQRLCGCVRVIYIFTLLWFAGNFLRSRPYSVPGYRSVSLPPSGHYF